MAGGGPCPRGCSAILTGDAKRRERDSALTGLPVTVHSAGDWRGQGSVHEAEHKGSITWRQEPGCTGLNSGCVTSDGLAALSGLQFHLKMRGTAERPVFPRLKETSRHRAVPGNGLKSPH